MPVTELPLLAESDVEPSNRVLILGAGYGGLRCAQTLGKMFDDLPTSPEIVLLDRYSYHQILTELPEAASGRIEHDEVALPLDTLLRRAKVRLEQAEIQRIDLQARQVVTTRGPMVYGTLVIALGSVTAFYNVPGLAECALTLKSVEDAQAVKARVTKIVAEAAQVEDPAERAALLSVLVGGAGLTGVELAGELAELLPKLATDHGLDPATARITLIESAPAVMPSMPQRLQSRSAAILGDLGIRLVLGNRVVSVDAQGVHLANGDRLVGRTVIWTGGIMAPALLAQSGLPTGRNGNVPVNDFLQVDEHPEIYVIGDAAEILTDGGQGALTPTAQVAVKQAQAAAYNIMAATRGWALRRYHPSDKGQVVSLGSERGVASVFDVGLTGRKVLALKALIAEGYRVEVTGNLFHRGRSFPVGPKDADEIE